METQVKKTSPSMMKLLLASALFSDIMAGCRPQDDIFGRNVSSDVLDEAERRRAKCGWPQTVEEYRTMCQEMKTENKKEWKEAMIEAYNLLFSSSITSDQASKVRKALLAQQ